MYILKGCHVNGSRADRRIRRCVCGWTCMQSGAAHPEQQSGCTHAQLREQQRLPRSPRRFHAANAAARLRTCRTPLLRVIRLQHPPGGCLCLLPQLQRSDLSSGSIHAGGCCLGSACPQPLSIIFSIYVCLHPQHPQTQWLTAAAERGHTNMSVDPHIPPECGREEVPSAGWGDWPGETGDAGMETLSREHVMQNTVKGHYEH